MTPCGRASISRPAAWQSVQQQAALDYYAAFPEEIDAHLAAVTNAVNTRGEVVGWRPEIDDGVLLNLAPLHTLMPSWAAEPRKAWEALVRGDYDWAHTARRYWPDRVEEACRHNKSFAIAHGLPIN